MINTICKSIKSVQKSRHPTGDWSKLAWRSLYTQKTCTTSPLFCPLNAICVPIRRTIFAQLRCGNIKHCSLTVIAVRFKLITSNYRQHLIPSKVNETSALHAFLYAFAAFRSATHSLHKHVCMCACVCVYACEFVHG